MRQPRLACAVLSLGLVGLAGCSTSGSSTVSDPAPLPTMPATTGAASQGSSASAAPTAAASRVHRHHRNRPHPTATPSTARPVTRSTRQPAHHPSPSSQPKPSATRSSTSGCAPTGHTATLTIDNEPTTPDAPYQFQPRTLTVGCGTKVTVTNDSTVSHTWTASNHSWDSGNLDQRQSYSYTFRSVGTFSFICAYHSYMTGMVTVTK